VPYRPGSVEPTLSAASAGNQQPNSRPASNAADRKPSQFPLIRHRFRRHWDLLQLFGTSCFFASDAAPQISAITAAEQRDISDIATEQHAFSAPEFNATGRYRTLFVLIPSDVKTQ
jgi:hypothetical protein